MARIRTIKPEFFDDEDIAAMSPQARLGFVGLWLQADREGRLKDQPGRLKARIFPFDDVDMDAVLEEMAQHNFIRRYQIGDARLIQVRTFRKHQFVNPREEPSQLPGPDGEVDLAGSYPNSVRRAVIYERDRFVCQYCDRDMSNDVRARSVDHVIPSSRGGSHEDRNLVTACKRCNCRKHNKTPDEAGMRWPSGYGQRVSKSGTLTDVNGPLTVAQPNVNDPLQPCNKEGKGREGNRKGKETRALCTEPKSVSVPQVPALTGFPVVGNGHTWDLTAETLAKLQTAYPNLDVLAQCRRAKSWLESNPRKRKTHNGMPRFLNAWMTTQVDRRSGGDRREDGPFIASAGTGPTWAEDCRTLGHDPPCNSSEQHELRKLVASRGCTHPGVCRSLGEHARKVAAAPQAAAS